jgi:antitoxin VapB
MQTQRRVRLFRHGGNQVVCIPREFELPGNDVIVRKSGDRLIVKPAPAQSLLAVLGELQAIADEFPVIGEANVLLHYFGLNQPAQIAPA